MKNIKGLNHNIHVFDNKHASSLNTVRSMTGIGHLKDFYLNFKLLPLLLKNLSIRKRMDTESTLFLITAAVMELTHWMHLMHLR